MEAGISVLAFIVVGLVALFAVVSVAGSRSSDEYEEEIRNLKEIIA